MTLRAGIFGYPIAHSVSPPMHQAAFSHAGFDVAYEAWETHPDDLAEGIEQLRRDSYVGANVTVPHKQAVVEHLDEVDDIAARIGAVNTIVNRGGRLFGSNTDARGFIASLKSGSGTEPAGRDVLLIGAGGAARAAAHALADERVGSLTIANRTVSRAASLAVEISQRGVPARGIGLLGGRFTEACSRSQLVVNSTSIGMLHGPAEGLSPIPAGAISQSCVVYDMVYNPPTTPLLRQAEASGAVGVGGLGMLVHQGAASWSMWMGEAAPVDVMFAAAREALGL